MSGFVHESVMVREVLAGLQVRPGGLWVDGTLGGGGHAEAILELSGPDGRLCGCDRDAEALVAATDRLARFGDRFEGRQGNFAELGGWVVAGSCDGVVLDLGVSSHELERPERGFSFLRDGPLDMRFDAREAVTAADLVNGESESELARLFWELGGERQARRLARGVVRAREQSRLTTTRQLARVVEALVPRAGRGVHPATRVFQALRMAVNDELGSLERGLAVVWSLLKPGGRLAVITFHSGEDRLVKAFGREGARDYDVVGDVDVPELRRPRAAWLRWVNRRAMKPGADELAANSRARSAQLRVMEKLG